MAAIMYGMMQKIRFVGDDDKRNVQILDEVDEAMFCLLIQPGGGLVQEQDPGLHGQHRCQRDQALLAPREFIGHPVGKTGQTQALQSRQGNLPGLGRGFPQVQRAEGHIFQNRRAEELVVGVLKEQPDLPAHRDEIFFGPDLPAEDDDAPGLGPQQAHDQVQEGGLAAAVGADEAQMVLRSQLKAEVLKDRPAGARISEGDAVDDDQGFGHGFLIPDGAGAIRSAG